MALELCPNCGIAIIYANPSCPLHGVAHPAAEQKPVPTPRKMRKSPTRKPLPRLSPESEALLMPFRGWRLDNLAYAIGAVMNVPLQDMKARVRNDAVIHARRIFAVCAYYGIQGKTTYQIRNYLDKSASWVVATLQEAPEYLNDPEVIALIRKVSFARGQ